MSYYRIVFISTATINFGEAELLRLLGQARKLNGQYNIAGILAYSEGKFMQVLEGEEAAVKTVYANIAADLRHGKLEKLADGPVARCEFANWHMGFAEAAHQQGHPNLVPLHRLPTVDSLRELLHDFLMASQLLLR